MTNETATRILVVDDEPTILKLWKDVLCPEGGFLTRSLEMEVLSAELFGEEHHCYTTLLSPSDSEIFIFLGKSYGFPQVCILFTAETTWSTTTAKTTLY